MSEKVGEGVAYNLLIDKERDDVLNFVFKGYLEQEAFAKTLLRTLEANNLTDTFMDLIDEFVDKSHKTHGCDDPHCSWESKNK